MKKEKLLPCPFCGGNRLTMNDSGYDDWFLVCDDCGADGPTAVTRYNAKYLWNDRSAPREAPPAKAVEPETQYPLLPEEK